MKIEIVNFHGRVRVETVEDMRSAVFYRWAAAAKVGESTTRVFRSAGIRKVTRIA